MCVGLLSGQTRRAGYYKIEAENLKSSSKERRVTEARRILCYIAAEIEDDGIPFEEKMAELSATLYGQFAEADRLEAAIRKNLEALVYGK